MIVLSIVKILALWLHGVLKKMKVKCYSYVYSSNGKMKQLKNS